LEFTNQFNAKYAKNPETEEKIAEMQAIINNTNEVLSPYFLDDKNIKDREIIYNTVYGYKLAIADKYDFSMDEVYRNISHLKEIVIKSEKELVHDDKANVFGYFSVKGELLEGDYNFNTNKQCFSTISIIDESNIEDSTYSETLTHELVHLFSQQYIENDNGDVDKIGRCGLEIDKHNKYLNEVITEKITVDILKKINHEIIDISINVKLDNIHLNHVNIPLNSTAYFGIAQTGNVFDAIFKEDIYTEMFEHTDNFTNRLNTLYDNKNNYSESISLLLEDSFNNMYGQNCTKLYKELSNTIFQVVDNDNLNIADYVNMMNSVNAQHKCELLLNNNQIDIFHALSESKEIEHFYKIFNKNFNPDTALEKEINPFTRSKDCTNFLIVMQSLKTNGIEYDIDNLENLTWKSIDRNNDNIVLMYKYDDENHYVLAKKDLNTGLIANLKNCELRDAQAYKKPSILQSFKNKESNLISEYDFDFISQFSKISDYSESIINISNSPETIVIHSVATGDINSFEANVGDMKLSKIVDSNNNNLLHILSRTENESDCFELLKKMKDLDVLDVKFMLKMKNYKETPEEKAIENNNYAFVNALCRTGFDIKNADKYNGKEVLLITKSDSTTSFAQKIESVPLIHYLQRTERYAAITEFIKSGYNPETKDNNGDTILHAIMKKEPLLFSDKKDIINALIQKNINTDIENKEQLTPLMLSCVSNQPSYMDVKYLCDGLRANPDYKNSENRTAVHYLLNKSIKCENDVESECFDLTLDELIKNKANINILGKSFNNEGEKITPIQISSGADYFNETDNIKKISYNNIATLINNGADINQSFGNIPSALEMAHLTRDVDMFKTFINCGISIDKLGVDNSNLSISEKMDLTKYNYDKTKDVVIDSNKKSKIVIVDLEVLKEAEMKHIDNDTSLEK